jgi:anti-sigma-K factor RskA
MFGDLWASLAFWRATGMAAAFASLLLALGVGYFADKASRQPVMIAVLVNDANQPGAILSAFADGRAELVPLGGTSIPHNHSMQVWTFPDPKGAPVSVGLIHDARTARLNLAAVPRLHAEQLFAISMEPLHGSPTGLPTGPVVLKGTASTAL